MKTVLYIENNNDFFGMDLLSGFVNEAKKKEWWNTLTLPHLDTFEPDVCDVLSQADGFVTRGASLEVIDKLDSFNKPHLILRSASSLKETSAPHVDDKEVGRIASDEISGLGLSHRAFLGYENVVWSEARREAFVQGGEIDSELLLKSEECKTPVGLVNVTKWLLTLPRSIAIFAASDDLAVKVTQAALLAGIKIPQEVAVIGADNNVHLCDNAVVRLSSIDLHAEIIGRKCAWAFAKQMNCIEDLVGQPLLRPPELVIRQSSHQVNKYFVIYKSAMSWINKHALIGPSVDELAVVCGVSRRSLERIFDKVDKTSPATVIREKRVKAILHLLARDDIPLANLAHQAKFSDQSSFSNFIQRNTGETPSAIRFKNSG